MKILLKFAQSATRPQYEDYPMRIQLTNVKQTKPKKLESFIKNKENN